MPGAGHLPGRCCIIGPMDDGTADTEVFGLATAMWDVIGTLATTLAFLVAAAAAMVAYRQLRHMEAARLDQSRPYVLVTVDNNPAAFHVIDLVVENAGAGPARDVVIKVDPPLTRVKEEKDYKLSESRLFSAPVPVLPPGFKIRTFFDSAIDRSSADVPQTHNVTITYNDGHGHEWTEHSVLDFSLLEGLQYTEVYEVHHVAKALQETNKLLKNSRLLKGDVVNAVVEPRDEYMARRKAEYEERQRTMAEWNERAKAQREARANESGGEPEAGDE